MTTVDNRGQGPQEQAFVHRVHTVIEPPQYASVQPMPNYAVTRSATDWSSIALVGIIAIALLGLIGLGFYNFGCHDKACYDAVAAVGVARANASAGVPTDVGSNGTISACTGKCWDAQKVKAVADANARANFGSNSGTDTVNAVAPPNTVAAPAPEVKVIYVTPPALQRHSSTCSTCAGGLPADRVAACSRLGAGHRLIAAPDGNYHCLDVQGRRVRPNGQLVAAR